MGYLGFVVGVVVGSCLNVVVYRWPLGIPLGSRFVCSRCAVSLGWGDVVPVLGYLFLGGRCRHCRAWIRPRLLVVELLTGVLFGWYGVVLAGMGVSPLVVTLLGIVGMAFIAVMILVSLIDWDHRVIPNLLTHGGIIVSLAIAPVLPWLHHAESDIEFGLHHSFLAHVFPGQRPYQHAVLASVTGAAVGLGIGMAVHVLGDLVLRKRLAREDIPSAFGLGDVKLLVFIGAFMGGKNVFAVFVLAALLGAVSGIGLKLFSGNAEKINGLSGLRRRWGSGDSVLPFGPFLAAGALVCVFMEKWLVGIVYG